MYVRGTRGRKMDVEIGTSSSSEASPTRPVRRSFFSRKKGRLGDSTHARTSIGTVKPNTSSVTNKTRQGQKRVSLKGISLRRRKQPKNGDRRSNDASATGDSSPHREALSDKETSPTSATSTGRGCQQKVSRNFMHGLSFPGRCKDDSGSAPDGEMIELTRPSVVDRTLVVANLNSPPKVDTMVVEEEREDASEPEPGPLSVFNCTTAILEHNYFERMCSPEKLSSFERDIYSKESEHLPEDPTIQESIECIFADQLAGGINLWDDEDTREHVEARNPDDLSHMVSPSLIQQSRQNRCDRQGNFLSQTRKRYEQASLVYVGTFDPTVEHDDIDIQENRDGPVQCSCDQSSLPALHPKDWPQAPLLLRPTPGKGTTIKGVRLGNSKEYLWEPGSHLSWSECLAREWGVPAAKEMPRIACCERCAVLPINNGNEKENESLSIDFESDLFDGTLLLRIRHAEGTTPKPYDDTKGYFSGVNRRYQAVIQGRFKKSIPFTGLSTGFQFDRPCGRLPAKFILRSSIKVLSFFAPQLDCKLEDEKPHSLTPLGSTPQVISLDGDEAPPIASTHDEPSDMERTLLGVAFEASSSLQRARARKKAFDKLFVQNSSEPQTDLSKIYTFEFLQHLFNFQDFSVELGSMLGRMELKDLLDGQPLQVMATYGEQRLWSFDIWHESLWEGAQRHETHHLST